MNLDDCLSVDVEATTWDPEKAKVIQIGVVECSSERSPFADRKFWRRFINPGEEALAEMGPDVIAVTGISPSYVRREGLSGVTAGKILDIGSDKVLVGHNYARYDRVVLESSGFRVASRPFIDTYRVVQEFYDVGKWDGPFSRVLPDMKLGTCYFGIVEEENWALDVPGRPHDALYDAYMTAKLLEAMLKYVDATVDQMIELSKTAYVPRVCWVGKHKGEPWADVPDSYLQWMASKEIWEKDEGRETAVLQELDKRGLL